MIEDFIRTAAGLKAVPRQGWIEKAGVDRPESVADHAYSTAVMAMIFGDMLGLDTEKLIRMSLLHDLAESITGDITPEKMPRDQKATLENNTMQNILQSLPESGAYAGLWKEYTSNNTPESRLFHEIDKLEMALQAVIYSEQHKTRSFDAFIESAADAIITPELKAVFDSLTGGGHTHG